jgi:CheY-like chemotaxis protein
VARRGPEGIEGRLTGPAVEALSKPFHSRGPATGASFFLAVLHPGVDEQRDGLILIVEDDEATKGFLADNLAADGFLVASASSAAEGLRAIEVRRPCLVLLDLRLEGGSGLDVLDRVRAADGLATRIDPDLPVIVLTGRAGEADRVRSFERGADDHVCKPSCRFRGVESRSWSGLALATGCSRFEFRPSSTANRTYPFSQSDSLRPAAW